MEWVHAHDWELRMRKEFEEGDVSLGAILVSSNIEVCCWSSDSWKSVTPSLRNYCFHESHHGALESCFMKTGCLISFGTNHCLLPRYECSLKAYHPSVVL